MSDRIRNEFWGEQIDAVLKEISREAAICDVKILEPGMIEAVLHNNPLAARSTNPIAFKKLHDLLMIGFVVREKAFDRLGAVEADALIKNIRETLIARYGPKLGAADKK
jgi:hypothetical protein